MGFGEKDNKEKKEEVDVPSSREKGKWGRLLRELNPRSPKIFYKPVKPCSKNFGLRRAEGGGKKKGRQKQTLNNVSKIEKRRQKT